MRELRGGFQSANERMGMSALIDDTGRYRYWLTRTWGADTRSIVTFLMLNPSTATAEVNDPTIVRCINFARSWGYAQLNVVNLFALRATDPKELKKAVDPVGPENDQHLSMLNRGTSDLVAAWGSKGDLFGRDKIVLALLTKRPIYVIGLTMSNQPVHPLYQKSCLPKKVWIE